MSCTPAHPNAKQKNNIRRNVGPFWITVLLTNAIQINFQAKGNLATLTHIYKGTPLLDGS